MVTKVINPTAKEQIDIEDVLLGGTWNINGEEISEQGHIFDYNFVDDTISDTRTYIFVETDIDTIVDSMFSMFNLYVCIFSHKTLVRLSDKTTPTLQDVIKDGYYGNRVDVLCDAVDRLLNGNKTFGIGKVNPASRGHLTLYSPNNKYYGKCLKYTVNNYNEGYDSCENN